MSALDAPGRVRGAAAFDLDLQLFPFAQFLIVVRFGFVVLVRLEGVGRAFFRERLFQFPFQKLVLCF